MIGKKSYTQIGDELGKTRSAIAGIIFRYKKLPKLIKKVPLVRPDKYEDYPRARSPKVNTKNLEQWLHSKTCRYLGSDYKIEAYQFCDNAPLPGKSYCDKHYKLTHKIKDKSATQL